jgi:predicted phage terminase large subunit-like protein
MAGITRRELLSGTAAILGATTTLATLPREKLERYALALAEYRKREERERCEASFYEFVKAAWPSIENAPFQDSWAIQALCEHLQAVSDGHIKRLLVNFPPRCGKSNVASICWPAWVWARKTRTFNSGPGVRFLCGSYNHDLSLNLSNKSRRLINSPWYQDHWGSTVIMRADQNNKTQFDNVEGGSRINSSVGGSLIGIGGDIIMVDDPHNTESVESEADRETVLNWWTELSSTRLNDPGQTAIVVIMQRLHEEDVSGVILDGPHRKDWVHLMLPMRYEQARHCATVLQRDSRNRVVQDWEDPRQIEGELLWPERYNEEFVARLEEGLGPYMASGRLQQSPSPKGGGIIKREWWQTYVAPDQVLNDKGQVVKSGSFPRWDLVIAAADTAYTEKEENDPTGFTVWGVWTEEPTGIDAKPLTYVDRRGNIVGMGFESRGIMQPRVMLIDAWRKRLELHGPEVPQAPGEPRADYLARAMPHWGLVEWIAHSCKSWGVNTLLIESKASGLSVAQEMRRLYGQQPWQVIERTPEGGDKVARLYAVQSLFTQGLVWAPDRKYADLVIDEVTGFPKGKYKDLTDSTSMALSWLRNTGILIRKEEREAMELEASRLKPQSIPLYPA